MIKNVYDYFENLEEKNLPKAKNCFVYDDQRITHQNSDKTTMFSTLPLTIDGTHYFSKSCNYEYSLAEIASSNMYNQIGMPTPPIAVIEKKGKNFKFPSIILANQDVDTVKGLEFKLAANVIPQIATIKQKMKSEYKWAPLYEWHLQQEFLKYMTKECFDQLVALFLLDELRTESDRHESNYFFYKSADAKKFEGVLPIDNEHMEMLNLIEFDGYDFKNFLSMPYITSNMFGDFDNKCYKDRINDIKELLQDQMLTPLQIELLKKAIKFDFPKEIQSVAQNPYLKKYRKYTYDCASRLWDYHQKDLGKELEL